MFGEKMSASPFSRQCSIPKTAKLSTRTFKATYSHVKLSFVADVKSRLVFSSLVRNRNRHTL